MRAVIPNLFRNRQIEVDKPKSCRRKRDFQAHAPLNQVQGDEMVALSFRTLSVGITSFFPPYIHARVAKVGWE